MKFFKICQIACKDICIIDTNVHWISLQTNIIYIVILTNPLRHACINKSWQYIAWKNVVEVQLRNYLDSDKYFQGRSILMFCHFTVFWICLTIMFFIRSIWLELFLWRVTQLIDWLGFNAIFNKFSVISRQPVHLPVLMFLGFLTPVLQTTLFPSNWLLFSHRSIAHWWKTNDACHNDFCQTLERMLAELGFKLTTLGLIARVATGARRRVTQGPFLSNNLEIRLQERILHFSTFLMPLQQILNRIYFFQQTTDSEWAHRQPWAFVSGDPKT